MNPQKNIEIALSDHELSELAIILEKATPKEPKENSSEQCYYPAYIYKCPTCDYDLGKFWDYKYCPKCGQRILWKG